MHSVLKQTMNYQIQTFTRYVPKLDNLEQYDDQLNIS